MSDFDPDIIIVGSGPAGVSTWLHLHRLAPALAARSLVLEKARHPRPKLCAGGVMRAADAVLARVRLRIETPCVPIHAVEFRYHGRRFYWRQRNYFRVVRRREFDAALVAAARQRGMRLHEGETFRRLARDGDGLLVETDQDSYRTRALVAADGANSAVRLGLGLRETRRLARLIEILTPADASRAPEHSQNKAVFDLNGWDQGLQGYVWDFPCWEDGRAAISRGIYDSRVFPGRPRADLKQLFRTALETRGAWQPDQPWQGHPERWFDPRAVFAQPHVLLVGDAAGVDPFAGEGISFALQYGEVAARELVTAFEAGDFSFSRYRQHLLAHAVGKELLLRRRLARLAYRGWPAVVFSVMAGILSHLWR